MKFAKILALILAFAMVFSAMAGCAKKEEAAPEPEPAAPEVTEPAPEPEPEPAIVNPLTGEVTETDISAHRPYAVMLNNLKVALPQCGISKADIIYEVLAEGGITRMLGVFQDVTGIGSIGTIRSARPYYIELAQGYDAVYIHAGGSPQAYSDLESKNIDHVDGVNGNLGSKVFFRDAARKANAGIEHSMFTTSDLLQENVDTLTEIRHDHADGYKFAQTFAEDGTPEGADAALIRAYFTNDKKTSFEYDDATGLYNVFEYGSPYVDGNTGAQVGVTNVLCLHTDVSRIAGDDKGRMAVRTTGSGTGYFACGGKIAEINWSRSSADEQFTYSLADGSPLALGVGHSYICILPMDSEVTYE